MLEEDGDIHGGEKDVTAMVA
jgi:hypothetical protein